MKHTFICVLFVYCCFGTCFCSSGSALGAAVCIGTQHLVHPLTSWNSCSESKLQEMYNEMREADCLNCDKYFHCMGNYKAVHSCTGALRTETAKMISDCRDSPSCTDADCLADRRANEFGRDGGNCASEYLCKNDCKYNPEDKTCKKSNCP